MKTVKTPPMTLFRAYLNNSKTQRVLSRKPGDKGFSLIELVVVVAVLAILSAIAIPAFTNISEKARASAASNTVAQIAKECATKIADAGSGNYNVPSMDGYRDSAASPTYGWMMGSTFYKTGSLACPTSGVIGLKSSDSSKYPDFNYNVGTGAKSCTASGDALTRGCPMTGGPW